MSAGLTSFDFARFDFFDFVSRGAAGSSKPNKFSFMKTSWRDICKKATDSSKTLCSTNVFTGSIYRSNEVISHRAYYI
jgi:hypothetical protein